MATAKTAAKKVETLVDDAQKVATDQYAKVTKSMEEAATFNQDTVDALMKCSNLAAKAVEEMNSELMSFSKRTVQEGVAAAKEMSSIKSVPELVEMQADLAKHSFDAFMKQSARFNEIYMSAAKEVYAPLNDRASAAAELVKGYSA